MAESRVPHSRHRWWIRATVVLVLCVLITYVGVYTGCRDRRGDTYDVTIGSTGGPGMRLLFGPLIWCEQRFRGHVNGDAELTLEAACKQARTEDKRVMLVITGQHCVPCRHLDRFLDENLSTITKYFVVAKVDIDTMVHAQAVHERFRDTADGEPDYIPYTVILDPAGKTLASSGELSDGAIGLPFASKADRDRYLEMLRISARNMSEIDLAAVDAAATAFEQRLKSK